MTTSGTPVRRLECMEIVGGNQAMRQQIQGFGLEIWIDSQPFDVGVGGGDIHYVSSCGSGEVTRMALADVSGHGAAVDRLAQTLRRLIRKHMNTFDQTQFARALNREFSALAEEGRFATALIATYFAPTGHLIVCNAGHCPPLWYRAAENRWVVMEPDVLGECESLRRSKARYHLRRINNLPLGILDPTEYAQFAVELSVGDLVVLYTDGITEAEDTGGAQLGTAGLLDLLTHGSADRAVAAGEQLLAALARRQGQQSAGDDSTLMVLERIAGETRPLSVGTTLRTLGKMLRLKRV